LLLTDVVIRAVIGAVVALGVVAVSRRAHALSTSGAVAAVIVGTLAVAAGWSWGALLFSMFVAASALSKAGNGQKAARLAAIVEKGSERDAYQVLANGGVFCAAALGQIISPSPVWLAMAAGALAASSADTWATEVGTMSAVDPISIITGKRVPPGTSGGITLVGTAASVAGALFIAVVAALAAWPTSFAAIAVGGSVGALADSVLGGTLQERRWCDLCSKETERLVHSCGTKTRLVGGLAGLNNDAVNAACSGIGALVALALS